MPEWPPLILDQANNLLVRNIHVNDPNTRMFCIFILFPRWQTRPRPTLAFEDCPCRSGRLRLCIARRNPSRTIRVEKYLRSSNCWQNFYHTAFYCPKKSVEKCEYLGGLILNLASRCWFSSSQMQWKWGTWPCAIGTGDKLSRAGLWQAVQVSSQ